jgi:hypothetical protein
LKAWSKAGKTPLLQHKLRQRLRQQRQLPQHL